MSDTQSPTTEDHLLVPHRIIDDPEDAATTAAYKLNVILTLVEDGARRADDLHTHDGNGDDDGGYGLMTAAKMITEVRDYLRRSVAKAEADRRAERDRGAQ
jgi:hypothetical protein